MTRLLFVGLAAWASLSALPCQTWPDTIGRGPEACPRAAIVDLNNRFAADMRKKAFDDVIGLYEPDASFSNAADPAITGTAALRRLYATVFATYDSDLHLGPGALSETPTAAGRLCRYDGAYAEHLGVRATGKVLSVKGHYSFTSRRSPDGRWRYVIMSWGP